MSDRFIDWLFDTLILVNVQHQELLRGFGDLLLIPFALFLLSYMRVSFAFIKDRADPLSVHSSAAAQPVGGIQKRELTLLSGGLP
jgi:hypothetical protein